MPLEIQGHVHLDMSTSLSAFPHPYPHVGQGQLCFPAAEALTWTMSPGLPLSQAFPNLTSEASSDQAISPPTVIQAAISSVLGAGSSSLDCLPALSFPNSTVHF